MSKRVSKKEAGMKHKRLYLKSREDATPKSGLRALSLKLAGAAISI
jgi:hypothetical protein